MSKMKPDLLALSGQLTRRDLLRTGMVAGWAGLATAVLAGCGGASSAAPPPQSGSGVAPASAAASAAPVSSPPTSGSSAAFSAPSTWEALLAAGQQEGQVVVTSAPDPDTREKLPQAFKQRYGIDVTYLPGATEVTARLQAERAAGQYTVDVEVNGSDSIYGTLWPNGWLDPLKPALLLPDAADSSKWKAGEPWFRDPRGDTVLQVFSTISSGVTVNLQNVQPSDVPTGDSLLDPKWKGKICAFDPGANGPGIAIGSALYVSKGPDYVTKLYKDQNVALTRDYRQLADWVAQGSYALGIGLPSSYLDAYIKAGVKFARLKLPDILSSVGGGFGQVAVLNRAPHPNAARVFANWIASKEGMALFSQLQSQAPARNDIDATWVPPDLVPQVGVKYLDTYDFEFETTQRLQIRDFFAKMLK